MKLKISVAMVSIALLTACGGGGGDDTGSVGDTPDNVPVLGEDRSNNPTPTTTTNEDRTRPASGQFASDSATLKSNTTAGLFSDTGVDADGDRDQFVNSSRVASWPGLRYGDFLVANNPWNDSAATYPSWYQDISLYETGDGYGVEFNWDWGASSDTDGPVYNTKSFPEVIYGVKSDFERSGSFAETGLPVEIYDAPVFTIDYGFEYGGWASNSPNVGAGTDSEFNVAIESFFHDSCDIVRTGDQTVDNTIFEVMVWLKDDERKPAGGAPIDVISTSDGRLFDVYVKDANLNRDLPGGVFDYIAFVAKDQNLSGTVMYSELLNVARDSAVTYGLSPLKDTDCLANILMGTEIWHGAGSFNLNEYTIHRSY